VLPNREVLTIKLFSWTAFIHKKPQILNVKCNEKYTQPRFFNGIILKLNKLKGYKYAYQSFQYIE